MIIGLDVGGTHTDAVLLSKEGPVKKVKVPTDSANLFQTVLNGLEAVTEGVDLGGIRRAVLSTTLAANMVAQNELPTVGMVVTAGPGIDPRHFRINTHYHVAKGAMDHRGHEITPLDTAELHTIGETFKAQKITCIGVVSKFSTRNPQHEKSAAKILASYVDHIFMGHQCSGSLNFPRRIATTYLNAAVFPVHRAFYTAVQQSLAHKGLNVPIGLLKPDGGNMNFETALAHPGQTILSGPSASVMGALPSAPSQGACLVLDIGGTTTDMALLVDGVPLLAPLGIEVGPHKTLIRALRTRSLGIGGDSWVRVCEGCLTIGPQRKGPAMAYGGPAPTPTDAFGVLGQLSDGDMQRAGEGLAPIAEALHVPLKTAALQVIELACRQIMAGAQAMTAAINAKPVYTVHELWAGSRIEPNHLLVLGGPAPQFADALKKVFDGRVDVVPHYQVANAIGCALARTTCEVTLFADTSQQTATAPEEGFSCAIGPHFDLEEARDMALQLLEAKAVRQGSDAGQLQTQVLEAAQFNMVRGFNTIGKNIRVRVQVKPGLIDLETS